MVQSLFRLALSLFIFVATGACGGTASHVTTIGPSQIGSAEKQCPFDATVTLTLLNGHKSDVVISGVYIGNGYIITDAYAPVLSAELIHATFVRYGTNFRRSVQAVLVRSDSGIGLALIKMPAQPVCSAILADMRLVSAGDDAHLSILDGLNRGSIVHPYRPFSEPGHLNEVMVLSANFSDAPIGSGIYAENGALLGIRVGSSNKSSDKVIALPASRIARFLEEYSVPYWQYNHTQQHSGYTHVSIVK